MFSLKGLATGIGSLPHKDADEALDLVFRYVPEIPFWPQLPKLGLREGMVAQFSEGLPCIEVTEKGVFFNPEDKEKELTKFYEKITNPDKDYSYFAISENYAQGLHAFYRRLQNVNLKLINHIKLQVTGPFTFAASLKDEKGMSLLHNHDFMQAITEGLIMKALWQIRFFEKFGKKIILFIDEPYLGCFGSAYTPINRETVVATLTEFAKRITSAGTLLCGVHCCGNTDWSIFTDIKFIDIISFDAYSFLDRLLLYSENLKTFFDQGRILCWGIVPTVEFTDEIKPRALMQRLNDALEKLAHKGLDPDVLSERLILSPSCGLGTLDTDKAEKIFSTLSSISKETRK